MLGQRAALGACEVVGAGSPVSALEPGARFDDGCHARFGCYQEWTTADELAAAAVPEGRIEAAGTAHAVAVGRAFVSRAVTGESAVAAGRRVGGAESVVAVCVGDAFTTTA